MWQYILIIASALMLFEFVIIGVIRYGLLSCYSAYAAKWHEFFPKLNLWSVVTFLSAALMIPVLVTTGEGSKWQFLGFLAPVFIGMVAASPEYATDKFQWWMHQIGAWGAVCFIIAYIAIIPQLLWVVIPLAIAGIFNSIIAKGTWMFWMEMVVYLSTYVVLGMRV